MRVLIRVDLKTLDVSLGTGHHHDNDVSDFPNFKDSQGITSVDLNEYKSLLLAAHVSRAARVRAEVCAELLIGRDEPLDLLIA